MNVPQHKKANRRLTMQRAMTLLELLIAIAVLSACMAVAGPITLTMLRGTGVRATLSDQLATIDRVNEAMRADVRFGSDGPAGCVARSATVRGVGDDRVILDMTEAEGPQRLVGYFAEKGKVWRVEKIGDAPQRVTSMWRLPRMTLTFSAESGQDRWLAIHAQWTIVSERLARVNPRTMGATLAATDGRDRPIELTKPEERVIQRATDPSVAPTPQPTPLDAESQKEGQR